MSCEWAPPLEFRGDRTLQEFIDHAYMLYKLDFTDTKPTYRQKHVKSMRLNPATRMCRDHKDHTFHHCIERGIEGYDTCEEHRYPREQLIERIRWPRVVIEYADVGCLDILAWEDSARRNRVNIFVPDLMYVVILDPTKKGFYYLLTTYIVDKPHALKKLIKSYERNTGDRSHGLE